MDYISRFMGETNTSIGDKELFNALFHTGSNEKLCLIATKTALPEQDPMNKHTHDHFEFTIPLSHNPTLFIEKKTFELPSHHVFPSNPGQAHGVAEKVPSNHLVAFQLDYQYLEATAFTFFRKRNVEFKNTPLPLDPQLETMLKLFMMESKLQQTGFAFILDNLSHMIAIHLLRSLESNIDKKEMIAVTPARKEISKSIEFFHEHINSEFSLEEVAGFADMSKYHFARVFKQETGKTPYQFFIDLKIQKAADMLKTGKFNVTDVCFMLGFKSHSHFTRVFSRKVGMAPSDFLNM